MKRTATTLIAALMALILTACGGDEIPNSQTGAPQQPAARPSPTRSCRRGRNASKAS